MAAITPFLEQQSDPAETDAERENFAMITPFLEQQSDPAETDAERENFAIPADVSQEMGTVESEVSLVEQLQGLGGDETVFSTYGLTAEVLDQSHAGLLNTAWLRQVVEDSLVDRGVQYRVQARDINGGRPNEVFIILDQDIQPPGDYTAPWNPASTPNARQFKLLSWTSKMGTPSFSLPAGPIQSGGSCPGAVAGQSIVPVPALLSGARRVQSVIGRPVRLQQAVCQYCYAEGGQYSTGQVQFAQVLRYIWTRESMRTDEGIEAWVEAMVYAVDNAKYMLEGGKFGKTHYLPERFDGRFFRIHDSGDFFSRQYLAAWKAIADALPDITFWAPSRYWATGNGIEQVNEINGDPRNLIIRPSAYHTNEPPPRDLGPGWATGSAVFGSVGDHELTVQQAAAGSDYGAFNWECQAYAVDDTGKTCRNALAPDGEEGCRMCWVRPDLEPMYILH
jgi:hypothetical protein